ncbi:MAG: Na/Pi cotransporter family protein [Pseudobdellovibrio sp.]
MLDFQNSYFIILIAGISFFLYGSSMASANLEKLMASKITSLLNKVNRSQFLSISVGVALTTILQSSGAVTSMLVGLGTAKVIKLPQVMGIIIGTAIGSALTVQLISLNLSVYALPTFALGFAVYFFAKKQTIRNLAGVLMGFALLFMGLRMVGESAHYFSKLEFLSEFFQSIRDNSFYSLAISMIFCAFVQSSAVTIGLAMSLASAGVLTTHDAMLWVYGANIGTTSTALFASVGSNYIGKQVAWAHFFYKAVSVLVFYPITAYFIELIEMIQPETNRVIANAHLIFNIISALAFFPFIKRGAALIEDLFPKSASDEFGAEFLTLNTYQNSSLAISYAQREIMRMADIVLNMIKDSVHLFETEDPVLVQSIKDRDNQVDFLYREIKMFLLDHANKSNTVVHQNIMNMIMFISDLERAADSIDINIRTLAIKKHALKLEFSHQGLVEIQAMHAQVVKVASMGINAYDTPHMCEIAIQLKRDLAKLEITYRENHISRLNQGLRETINTSSIHLDLLSEYRRIASLLCNHAYATTKIKASDTRTEEPEGENS